MERNGSGTELADILETIEKQQFVNPQRLLEQFWNVFVVDSFLGNFDRHNGNWGFLYDEELESAEIAPVFDCGSCLLPQADEKIMKKVLDDENELNARIFQFPTSAIKSDDRKINYYDFISSASNEDCNHAVLRIVPKIDIEKINEFIDGVPYISKIQRDFFKTYIKARYEKILVPTYEKLRK